MANIAFCGILFLYVLQSQAFKHDPIGQSQVRQRPGTFDEFTTQASIAIKSKDVEIIKKSEKLSTKTKVNDKLIKEDSVITSKTEDKTASLKTSSASKSTKDIRLQSDSIVKKGTSSSSGKNGGGASIAIKKSENLSSVKSSVSLDQTNLEVESIGGNRGLSIGREIKHGTLDALHEETGIKEALDASSAIVVPKGGGSIKTTLESGVDIAAKDSKGGGIKSDKITSAKGIKTTSIESEAERVENLKAVHTADVVIAGSTGGEIKSSESHSSKGIKTTLTSATEKLTSDAISSSEIIAGTDVGSSIKTVAESHSESVVKDSKEVVAGINVDSVKEETTEVKESDSLHTKAIKTVFVDSEDEDDKSQNVEHLDVVAASKITKKQDHKNYADDDEIALLTGQEVKTKDETVKIKSESSHTRTKVGHGSRKTALETDTHADVSEECCKKVLVSEETRTEGDTIAVRRKYKTKGPLGQIIYSIETFRRTIKPTRTFGSSGTSTIYKASSFDSSSSGSHYNYDSDEEDQVNPVPRGDLNIALDKMRASGGDHSEWESADASSYNGQGVGGTKLTGHSSTVIKKKISTFSSGGPISTANVERHDSFETDETYGDAYLKGSSSSIKTTKKEDHKSTSQTKVRGIRSFRKEAGLDAHSKDSSRHVDNYETGTKRLRPKRSDTITTQGSPSIESGVEKTFKDGDTNSESSSGSIRTTKKKDHKTTGQTKSRDHRSIADRKEAGDLVRYIGDSSLETGTKRPRPKRSDIITARSSALPRKCGKIMLGAVETAETTKIVGGTEVRAGTWPWLMTFQHEGYHFCGGTLISDRHIISATHCFPDFMPPFNLTVHAGKHIKEGVVLPIEQKRKIKRLVKHLAFNRAGKFDNDIALVEVDSPFIFGEYIQPACLPGLNEKIDPKAKCCVAGFGDTRKTGNDDVMNELCVPLLPRNLCNSTEFYNGRLTSTMMCAGFEDGKKDSCKGDSGGPLICNMRGVHKLFGITSWGEDCAKPKRPGLYTDISLFQNWIRENL